ncbi:PKD domain-containing protein [Candidatus Bipolaricaulota bacterium]|nr:PKD domain-containing protein [Candidatus Bipolaricaulota bacterium]
MKRKASQLGIAALFLITFAAFTSLGQDNVAPLGIFPSPPESSELEVRIWVDKGAYQVGDPIVIHYSVNKPAYIYVWDIYPDGTAAPLFPNTLPGGSDNYVQAGEHVVLPNNWVIGPPLGTERMQILATTSPVDPFAFFSPEDPAAFQAQVEVQILGILPVTERSWDFTSFEIVEGPPSSYGTLVINSTPSGGLIYLDGEYAGYTPRTLFVSQGFHQISVTKPGYLGWQAATLIIGNITRTINVTLVPLFPTNASPTADFSYSPVNPPVGAWVQFDGSGSIDSDGTIVGYTWNFGDGSIDSGVSQWHRFNTPGTYVVTLTVTDDDGASDTMTQAVQIGSSNQAPVAAFSWTPTHPMVNEWVQLNATASTDADGTIASYAWNFGDGSTGTGSQVWHRFSISGTYVVSLTVTDDDGATDSTSLAIQVGPSNQSPVANFTFSPPNPLVNGWVQFDASSSSDPDGSIANYAWDFGDGSTGTGSVVWHRFTNATMYMVTLTVTDNDGATNANTQMVQVGGSVNAAPTASFSYLPASPAIGEWVRFDGTGSTDSDGSISSYQWSFGDGTPPVSGPVVYHQFAGAGTYIVSLTVTDNDGATDTSSQSVGLGTVQQAPVALFTFSPAVPVVGESVSFNASTSYDPDGGVVSYRWDLDGNGVDDVFAPTVNATYHTPGIAMVRLTVIDNDGLSSTSVQGVVITATGGTPGAPAMGTTPGVFVWGTDSWHLTVNAGAGWFTPHSYRLELRSDDPFQNIGQSSSGVVVPLGILPAPTDGGKTLVFEGALQTGSVDYEFRVPNSSSIWMKLDLDIDGNGTLDTSSSFVYLRHSMVHPPTSPFVVGLPSGSSDELTPSINFRVGSAISYTETTRFVFWTTTILNLEAP